MRLSKQLETEFCYKLERLKNECVNLSIQYKFGLS